MRDGRVPLEVGDRLELKDVGSLTFDPEDAGPGPAGKLELTVEDGKGGEANATVSVEIVAPDQPASTSLDEALWRRLGPGAGGDDLRAFVQLFPQSPVRGRGPAAPGADGRRCAAGPATTGGPGQGGPGRAAALREGSLAPAEEPKRPTAPAAAEPKVAEATPPAPSRPTPRTNGDGTSFQDCPDCPVLVRVPAGSFTMGRETATAASGRPTR